MQTFLVALLALLGSTSALAHEPACYDRGPHAGLDALKVPTRVCLDSFSYTLEPYSIFGRARAEGFIGTPPQMKAFQEAPAFQVSSWKNERGGFEVNAPIYRSWDNWNFCEAYQSATISVRFELDADRKQISDLKIVANYMESIDPCHAGPSLDQEVVFTAP
jgi:hypothetical protein